MIVTAPAEYQNLLFRLCASSIARMSHAEPVPMTALRDAGLHAMLRSSARRLLEAEVFAREVRSAADLGTAGAGVPGEAAPSRGGGRKTPIRGGASIDWSNVGYDPRYRGIEPLQWQDELRYVVLAKAGDVFARQKLTVHYLPLLHSVARRYRNRGLATSELVNEGIFGLARAIQRFQPARHLRFGTYAKWWMRHAMEHALATQGRLVRLPVNVLRAQRKEARAQRDHDGESHVRPAERAVLEEVDAESVELGLTRREEETGTEIGVDEVTPESLVGEGQQSGLLASALSRLSTREREVLVRRFGLNAEEPRTLMETAAQLGLSHERVRQIQNGALLKLRALLTRGDTVTTPDPGGRESSKEAP
jgi:RNA polymerase nonessential primary-like sigma factor